MVRAWPAVLALLLALALVAAAPGLARADTPPAKAGEKSPPVLEPRYDLGIWTIVTFVLLLLVLWKWAWGPMLEGLHNREKSIQGALDEARKSQEEAQKLREQFQAEMTKANEKVRDLLDEGRKDAERVTAEMMGKARADIQGERDRLQREMRSAHDQALQDLWAQAAQLASLVSTKAIRRELTPEDHRRFVDEALADLRRAGGNDRRTA
jgi:F-type H+-transporting ATPase subunit b